MNDLPGSLNEYVRAIEADRGGPCVMIWRFEDAPLVLQKLPGADICLRSPRETKWIAVIPPGLKESYRQSGVVLEVELPDGCLMQFFVQEN